MWILQNSKELWNPKILLKSILFFYTYTAISHNTLRTMLFDIINSFFSIQRGRVNYLVIGHLKNYFVKKYSDCAYNYTEVNIKKMQVFLIDNIYVVKRVIVTISWIPMGNNATPMLAILFLYSNEGDFIQKCVR